MNIEEFNKKDILGDFEYELNKLCQSCIGTVTEIQIKQQPLISLFHQLVWFYEKEKGENVKLRLQDIPLIEGELKAYKDRVNELKQELEKEKEKNKNAYRKANNYLYFNDSADYEVALWEVIRKLRPDLAEKWDNGEDAHLEYIEEE